MIDLRILFLVVAQFLLCRGIDFPEAVIDPDNCPVGPGVHRGRITLGTIATCRCEVKDSGVYTAQARWFTRQGVVVGAENRLDQSSTLTIGFNSADPDQKYECRVAGSQSNYYYVTFTPLFSYPSCYVVLEKGQSSSIQNTVPKNVSSITWQVFNGHSYTDLTTCSSNYQCTNQVSRYQAYASSSTLSTYTSQLRINDARVNETNFRCLSNDRRILGICSLEVYAWPTQPVCQSPTIDSTNTFVELTCAISNVFPRVRSFIFSSQLNPKNLVVDGNNSVCNVSGIGSGIYGDVYETCAWRFPISGMYPGVYLFYIQVKADLSDYTTVKQADSESQRITFDMKLPVAEINNCPHGGGVRNGQIKFGTQATCRCYLNPAGFPRGQARWYTSSNQIVGLEDPSDGSSTLTLDYQNSDVHQSYECRPITTLPGTTRGVTFTASFTSHAAGTVFKKQSGLILIVTVILTPFLCLHMVTAQFFHF